MLCSALKPLLKAPIIKHNLGLVVSEYSIIPRAFISRSSFILYGREYKKKFDEKSQKSFEKVVQDFDEKLSHGFLEERSDEGNPGSSDGWVKRNKRLFVLLGAGLLAFGLVEYYLFFLHCKSDARKMNARSFGTPQIGAPWCLLNDKGEPEGSEDLKGNWLLMYFGFTHCPDVCPDELEKMIRIVDELDKSKELKFNVIPVFISVDPERDTPSRVREYCLEFSPKLKGYTGSTEQVAKVAKDFRVYYKAGPRMSKKSNDYVVDHSVMVYLINPEGKFADFYAQNREEKEVVEMIKLREKEYNAQRKSAVFQLFKK